MKLLSNKVVLLFVLYAVVSFSFSVFYEWPEKPVPTKVTGNETVISGFFIIIGEAASAAAREAGKMYKFFSILTGLTIAYFFILTIIVRTGWKGFVLRSIVALSFCLLAVIFLQEFIEALGFYFTTMLLMVSVTYWVTLNDGCFNQEK